MPAIEAVGPLTTAMAQTAEGEGLEGKKKAS